MVRQTLEENTHKRNTFPHTQTPSSLALSKRTSKTMAPDSRAKDSLWNDSVGYSSADEEPSLGQHWMAGRMQRTRNRDERLRSNQQRLLKERLRHGHLLMQYPANNGLSMSSESLYSPPSTPQSPVPPVQLLPPDQADRNKKTSLPAVPGATRADSRQPASK